jgi:hypothetical protein
MKNTVESTEINLFVMPVKMVVWSKCGSKRIVLAKQTAASLPTLGVS